VLTGTGSSIWEHVAPAISDAQHEVVIVTCFWAASSSQKSVGECLRKLSDAAFRRGTHRVRVFLGISSLSLWQKLSQTSDLNGWEIPPKLWASKLGLPAEDEIPGVDLRVKSIFVRPFSVMHPKFILVDRRLAILPSCNVSWEDWYEGAAVMSGPIVSNFLTFFQDFWLHHDEELEPLPLLSGVPTLPEATTHDPNLNIFPFPAPLSVQSAFLPSPHHINPHFRPWPMSAPVPRPTPLNHFLLRAFAGAKKQVFLQTPNVTAAPVSTAILEALLRGVDVHVRTSANLMVLEQLVTAGTTTAWTLNALIREYEVGKQKAAGDVERGLRVGKLMIEFFEAREGSLAGEPEQSHVKVSIFDEDITVLGSGNMDRASWWTSQELGIAFSSGDLAKAVKTVLDKGCKGRLRLRYNSEVEGDQRS
jgi:phosphatidylserine/phosphatidylglycerophosphate/cardiolipin synthase-like enzyme